MQYNIGIESKVFVLENNIAFLAETAFCSAEASTSPKAFFWFGQIIPHTLKAIIVPNHIPIPIISTFPSEVSSVRAS